MIEKLKPTNVRNIIDKSIFPLELFILILLPISLYFALLDSPPDYQQGETVRIMYIHVPSAWLSMGLYVLLGIFSLIHLSSSSRICDLVSRSISPVGASFALVTLITGSIWGKPMWGAWWVWDARLTSMFILFLFYLGHIAICNATKDIESKSPSILAIIGLINVPIVKFSVDFWNSLHQKASIIRMGAPTIHSSMLLPLFLMFLSLSLLAILMIFYRLKLKLFRKHF